MSAASGSSALSFRPGSPGQISRNPHRRRARHRLRRHRHQPALRAARVLPRRARHRADARQRARRAVADLLGADADHLDQVPDLRDARRQQGRGRHPRADGAGVAADRQRRRAARRADRARPVRRGAALRRRHDHAGHLGAQRGRGPRTSPRTVFEPYVVPITIAILLGPVPDPVARHRARRRRSSGR